jgi:hypothetical protein
VSFDLVVLSATRPLDANAARDAYHRIAAGAVWSDVLEEDPRIAKFAAAFESHWPMTAEVDASPAYVILSISGSAPDEVIPFCESTAMQLGLNLFDPQDETLYARGQPPRKATPLPRPTLICARCGKLIEGMHIESPGLGQPPRLLHMECFAQETRSTPS